MVATSGAKTLDAGTSTFSTLLVSGAGSFTLSAHATATADMRILAAGGFALSSGQTLAVGNTFENRVGGAATSWTGSTLRLYGVAAQTINSKSTGGDLYGTMLLEPGAKVSMWNSSSTAYAVASSAYLYSMDHSASDGELDIWGSYARTTGTDHWSYATDFDGTTLAGAARRQARIRFASGASATFDSGATLSLQGGVAASTSVDRQGVSGNYSVVVRDAFVDASEYTFRNLDTSGLQLLGTTTITSLDYGDFTLDVDGGSTITIASSTIDQNASSLVNLVRFELSGGVTPGANVKRTGTTTNVITFQDAFGAFSGEAYDEDGGDACGSIRWNDSACLETDQRAYRWRNDDGAEGAPASEWFDASWSSRRHLEVSNSTTTAFTNLAVRFDLPYDSDMQSDFDDLRFTDSSGTTSIPYWIESYDASQATVWVRVPTLSASSYADLYVYYGNGMAGAGSSGTSTFTFFEDFEDNSLSEYSGDTSMFAPSTALNYERVYGLGASTGNEGNRTTDGIGQASLGIGRNTTFRFFQNINLSTGGSDEPCVLFGVQSPVTANQNYGVCLQPFGQDKIVIAKDVAYNGRSDGSTLLVQKNVTWASGWYEVIVDWLSAGDRINVSVYDSGGSLFATTTATSSSYTSGGIGFAYWGLHGGWDQYTAKTYASDAPTVAVGLEQQDSGATWKMAENTALLNQRSNENVRLRLLVRNSGTSVAAQTYRLQVAAKGVSPNCESVPSGNYADVTTTSSGCGSSPACMTTSSQFTDQASTTRLLSPQRGFTYTYGKIMEDPSDESAGLDLDSNVFTELEYNFQMTAFATQDRYCFRTTNGSTALDNYTRVAELKVLHAPTISNMSFNSDRHISLTEGTATIISATATVTDLNGYLDLFAATSTFYRSSVAGATACTADENDCYQIASTSCAFSDCGGSSCTLACQVFMQFFADPTDAGSDFEDDIWDSILDVWDTSLAHARSSSTREVYTLRALTVPSAVNYGDIIVGQDTADYNATTSVTNTGNALLNLLLSGVDMTAGSSTIPTEQQKYATSTFVYSSCTTCAALATTSSPFPIGVDKPTTTSAFFRNMYWGLAVPGGTAATTHQGINTFLAN
jgi:hypothetical protein